jgi:hypothetical protein
MENVESNVALRRQSLFPPKRGRNSIVIRCFSELRLKARGHLGSRSGARTSLSPLYRYGGKSGDSMHAEPHLRTSCHYQILPLNPFLSNGRLKRKGFPEVARLTWAQEVWSSNPRAPTTTERSGLRGTGPSIQFLSAVIKSVFSENPAAPGSKLTLFLLKRSGPMASAKWRLRAPARRDRSTPTHAREIPRDRLVERIGLRQKSCCRG